MEAPFRTPTTAMRWHFADLKAGSSQGDFSVSIQSATWIMTARMLRRSGFGTTGATVDLVLSDGDIKTSVASILETDFANDAGALATPIPVFDTAPARKDHPGPEDEKLLWRRSEELTLWWLRRMITVRQPAAEKLTFVWHNHFATRINAVRSAQLMARQNTSIRENILGDFRTLALAMLTDGAMLRWLNGDQNTAKSPNENLAREFMELFALGHGNGYTEADVREGARALTGWVVNRDESVRFDPERYDARTKTVLGVENEIDSTAFCDIVLAQPKSAEFVARSLWRQLASDTPPDYNTLGRLIDAYGSSRDLKALTATILSAPDFLQGRGTYVNSPVDWFVGLLRTLKVPCDDPRLLRDVARRLDSLGQLPFHPPSVGGWPGGQAWLSTATAGLRMSAASMAAKHGDISSIVDASANERVESVAYMLGIGSLSDQTVTALNRYTRDPEALIAAAANTPEYLTS